MTIKLYHENIYQKELYSTITNIETHKDYSLITLSETIFFPTGGGQSCDIGTINNCLVESVYEENDNITHKVIHNDNNSNSLIVGNKVYSKINWKRRFDNMQRHCGEHILSGVFHKLFNAVNKGFHMGKDYMTIDLDFINNNGSNNDSSKSILTWEMIKKAELEANKIIWQNLPITLSKFNSKKDAESMLVRKNLKIEKNISIVTIGNIDNPADCVACCGTHPKSSGEVGLIKIYSFEKNKGMYRIYFEAGERAFKNYQNEFEILQSLERKLSTKKEFLLNSYEKISNKSQKVKNEKKELLNLLIENEIKNTQLDSYAISNNKYFIEKTFNNIDIDDLTLIGKKIISHYKSENLILSIYSKVSSTFILFSNNLPLEDILCNIDKNIGFKGGGNNNFARIKLDNSENKNKLISEIKRILS